ncbi:MAG: glycosyl transferase family 1 [Flammeovirgaceae bacterium]|nr:glycosyl transferase family 1 [Flammeovirgaceae bacterium]
MTGQLFDVLKIINVWRLIKNIQPDVVQTWMYHADLIGGLAARFAGVHTVIWGIHSTVLKYGETKFATICIVYLLALFSYFIPKRIIVCANQSKKAHVRLWYRKSIIRVVANGYDLSHFSIDIKKKRAWMDEFVLNQEIPCLGMVGRFDSYKDHNNLIEALSLLRSRKYDFRCFLIGAKMDEENTELVKLVESNGLAKQIELVGSRADIPVVMNGLDIHILSSSMEAFPNVLAEAMACGTPCVSTDVGDAAFILGETGWLTPPRDPRKLANKIAEAINCLFAPGWKDRQNAARKRIVDNFSIDTMARQYQSIWIES